MVYLESIMLIALGFVLASLIALFMLRLVWHHGERVGRRRVQQQFPTTSEELRADRARLRAENAMLVRRHEMRIQDYKLLLHERHRDFADARAQIETLTQELRQREDQITKLRAGRSPLEEELAERTAALQALQRSAREYLDQIQRLSRELEAAHETIRDRDRQIDQLEQKLADVPAASAGDVPAASAAVLPFAKANGSGEPHHLPTGPSDQKPDVVPAILSLREEPEEHGVQGKPIAAKKTANGEQSAEAAAGREPHGAELTGSGEAKAESSATEPLSPLPNAAAREKNGAAPADSVDASEPKLEDAVAAEGRNPLGKLRAAKKRRSGRGAAPAARDSNVAKLVQ
ncbi:hypothetical protein [Rhodoligotrophos defluvii]|uniref:hypothetical protein n=1 Tax=Rhodoligotrophos defluvii TaxID=2561934 RepID=UPI0010CA1FD3|nr:hypothetical protein [Rhodoligotrophos defluvii]